MGALEGTGGASQWRNKNRWQNDIPGMGDVTLSFPLALEGTGDGDPGGETAGRFFPATTDAKVAFEGGAAGETARADWGVVCGTVDVAFIGAGNGITVDECRIDGAVEILSLKVSDVALVATRLRAADTADT